MEKRKSIISIKWTIFLLFFLAVGLFCVLWLLGRSSEYNAEKSLWLLSQELEQLAQDPQFAPRGGFENLNAKFKSFYRKFPDSLQIPAAKMHQAKMFVLKKDFDSAHNVLDEMILSNEQVPEIVLMGLSEKGRIYGIQKNVDGIIAIYDQILEEYPSSALGLAMPLSKVEIFIRLNDVRSSVQAFQFAEKYYLDLIESDIEPRILQSRVLLARLYVLMKRWDDAMGLYQDILSMYAETQFLNRSTAYMAIRSINVIATEKINDVTSAIVFYKGFIQSHPGHPLNEALSQVIIGLEDFAQKNGSLPESLDLSDG